MGCDIHCYMEFRHKDGKDWQDFGRRINPGRNYTLFGYLAGVRGGPALVEPRGLPEGLAYYARNDASLYISDHEDEGNVTPEMAANFASGGCEYINDRNGKPWRVTHPDWHNHSWLTVGEFEAALAMMTEYRGYLTEYLAVLAALKSLQENAGEARLVFWFDN